MKKKLLLLLLSTLLITGALFSETIRVALEPMPPFINEGFIGNSNPGISVKLLKMLEKELGVTFEYTEAPYNRLKSGLETNEYDLVGHMPYKVEVTEFYEYGIDVDWTVDVPADIYTMDKANLEKINSLTIGTPRGNKEFAAELTGIPVDQFYDNGTIDSLLKMLYSGRIDAFWFPRAVTVPFIEGSGKTVYYTQFPLESPPISFAVQNNDKGLKLKSRIETALKKIDIATLYKEILIYNNMPSSGQVK